MYHPKSEYIRVPSNIHPHMYGEEEEDIFYSAQNTPSSRPQSIQTSIQNFAGSYSRASALYPADLLSLQGNTTTLDEEECLFKAKTNETFSEAPYRTFSQRTSDHVHFTGEPLSRHTTVGSIISRQLSTIGDKEDHIVKKSSFVQTVFNAANILVGVGILALPLSFRLAGWFFGSLIVLFCCLGTNYTAKVIIKCLNANKDNNEGTYGDIGQLAFGYRGRRFIGIIFVVELITMGVAMIVLLGDGIQSLFPQLGLASTRLVSFVILLPTVFLPIKKLAYTSLIGIIACVCLVVIVSYDGLSKSTKPGSLLDPMYTEFIPSDLSNLPLSFGLIMSGFAGHAVFPSIYRDMKDPKQYNHMVDLTYLIAAVVYGFMAITGYLMFGQEALQEITQNLALVDEYSQMLNHFAIWLLVLTPIAKYGIMLHPLNLGWELTLVHNVRVETWLNGVAWKRNVVTVLGRVSVTALLVYIAFVFPGFDKVMSLLGSFFSFTISIILPLVCHLRLFKGKLSTTETILNYFLLLIAAMMTILGTIWSFRPTEI